MDTNTIALPPRASLKGPDNPPLETHLHTRPEPSWNLGVLCPLFTCRYQLGLQMLPQVTKWKQGQLQASRQVRCSLGPRRHPVPTFLLCALAPSKPSLRNQRRSWGPTGRMSLTISPPDGWVPSPVSQLHRDTTQRSPTSQATALLYGGACKRHRPRRARPVGSSTRRE